MAKEKNYDKKINVKRNFSEYWRLLKKYKLILFFLILSVIIVELMQVVPKFLFKIIVDDGTLFAAGNIPLEIFSKTLLLIAVVYILANLIQITGFWLRSHLVAILETNMMTDVKQKYFNHILELDHKFHASNKTGSLISRLGRGSVSIERLTDVIAFNFVPLILQLIIVGSSIAFFSLSSTLVMFAITISFVIFSIFLQKIQRPHRLTANKSEDSEKANISDVLTNIDSIKYFGKEKSIQKRFKTITENTQKMNMKFWGYFKWMSVGQISIVVIGTVLLLYFPLMKFLAGEITLGTIVFIYTLYGNLMGPLWSFVHGMQGFNRSMTDFQTLFEYGEIKKEIIDKQGASNAKIKRGEIEFKNINFKYSNRKIFENFNLKILSNKKYALVGHSGCGKSTLMKLLYRLYDIQDGEILIDKTNIKNFKQESIRSEMAIVPQEAVLFDDTIYNNIKFSKPSATKKEIQKAIKFAQLDKIIENMDEKENTIVGERGIKLSGGEKQRVSIARALLANKKILVLDEATSALDSETEHEIQKDLEKLMEGRTSIIIAHRLSTIMHADKIIVMKKGKIVQSGTHKQLIGQRGEYKKLWNLQKGGYIK